MKRQLINSLKVLGICGAAAACGCETRMVAAQVFIRPRIVQPYVFHPRIYVPGPVVVAPPVYVAPQVIPPPVVVLPTPVVIPAPVVVETPAPVITAQVTDLHPLLAPIALYPDPLLSVVLPAATYPQQVAQAAQFLAANPSAADALIDAQPWEPSVKALVRYPTVLNQMSGNPQWTESLGSAFASEPANVSRAIQELRAQALAVGSLMASAQIAVVQDAGVIAIQPAVETALYVPVYNPLTVYTEPAVLAFDTPYVTGPWLVNGYDWAGGTVFVGDWRGAYVVHDRVWVRNTVFRVDHYHYWRHEERFGPAPHLAHGQWVHHQALRGNESTFRNSLTRARTAQPKPTPTAPQHESRPTREVQTSRPTEKPRPQQTEKGKPQPSHPSQTSSADGHNPHGGGGGGGGGGKHK